MAEARTALITGANRGMGLHAARQLAGLGFNVVLGARVSAKGEAAAETLRGEGLEADCVVLDVTDGENVAAAVAQTADKHGAIDVLINNAGILPGGGGILTVSDDIVAECFNINALGALRVARQVVPHMRKTGYGRIVNVSSGLAQFSRLSGPQAAYNISKAAMNALTVLLAAELGPGNIKVNAAAPGWVRTDMGGPSAPRSLEEGTDTTVWLATLGDDGPTGGFFQNRERIEW